MINQARVTPPVERSVGAAGRRREAAGRKHVGRGATTLTEMEEPGKGRRCGDKRKARSVTQVRAPFSEPSRRCNEGLGLQRRLHLM